MHIYNHGLEVITYDCGFLGMQVNLNADYNEPDDRGVLCGGLQIFGEAQLTLANPLWFKSEGMLDVLYQVHRYDDYSSLTKENTLQLWDALVSLGYTEDSLKGTYAILNLIQVKEQYRRRHLGEIYLQKIIDYLVKVGVSCLILSPSSDLGTDRDVLISFYSKFGFSFPAQKKENRVHYMLLDLEPVQCGTMLDVPPADSFIKNMEGH